MRAFEERHLKKNEKSFKKPLDKPHKVWYNKYIKGKENPTNQKGIDTMKKMTYVDALNAAIAVVTDEAVVEKLTALRDATAKRNAADRKPTKTQQANEAIKADILAFLADGAAHTVTEIIEGTPSLNGASNQKAASLVRQLVDSNAVVREEVKRKAYFKLA